MSRNGRGLDRRGVKVWFESLSLEAQQAVLDDFSSAMEASREQRISELEDELSKLRGDTVKAPRKKRAAVRRASPKKGVKVPPKYIHKPSGKTWAGRGVQPVWVRDHIKKGGKLDDLLIGKGRGR